MRKSRFNEEPMVKLLLEADKSPVGEVAKKLLAEREFTIEVKEINANTQ